MAIITVSFFITLVAIIALTASIIHVANNPGQASDFFATFKVMVATVTCSLVVFKLSSGFAGKGADPFAILLYQRSIKVAGSGLLAVAVYLFYKH